LVDRWTILSFINLKGQMVLTNNQHPVAEASSVERDEATVVERDEAMVELMAGAEVEEFNPVRIISPTPSLT